MRQTITDTITDTRTLVTETCFTCGVLFAMDADLHERLLDDSERIFYCPNGHAQHYPGKSLRQQLKAAKDEAERARRQQANTEENLRIERASHSATRGHLTRARTQVERIERGVCPHCHRSFANVARHMASQHQEN